MCKIALREAKCVLTLLVDPAEKFIIVSRMLNPAQSSVTEQQSAHAPDPLRDGM